MSNQKSVIYINGNDVLISSIEENSNLDLKYKKRSMSLQEFISTIKSSDQTISTKMFSQKTIKYEQTSNRIIIHMFSEPCKVNLKTRENSEIVEYNNAAFPGFIMKAEFDKNENFYQSDIIAVKNCYSAFDITQNTKQYIMPFPNVYSRSNKVCWNRTLDGITLNLRNANLLMDVFKTSVFNYDLFDVALNKIKAVKPEIKSLSEYFKYLTTVEEFPEEFYFESWD